MWRNVSINKREGASGNFYGFITNRQTAVLLQIWKIMRDEENKIFARNYDEEFSENISSLSTDRDLCCNRLLTEFIQKTNGRS